MIRLDKALDRGADAVVDVEGDSKSDVGPLRSLKYEAEAMVHG